MLVYLFVLHSSFFEHRLFYSVRTQNKQANPNFLLASNTRCLSSDAQKHGILSKETCTYPFRRQPWVLSRVSWCECAMSFTYARFLQTDRRLYNRQKCVQ